MPKLRKMLGDVNSQACLEIMRLMETQSHTTLATWVVDYAKNNYLAIYQKTCPADTCMDEIVTACQEALKNGTRKPSEQKPLLKEAAQLARDIEEDNPVAQAAARAVATACATIQTPTNALGFLFYGAAAVSYSKAGLSQSTEVYNQMALEEFKRALVSLQEASISNEPNPVKIKWNC